MSNSADVHAGKATLLFGAIATVSENKTCHSSSDDHSE